MAVTAAKRLLTSLLLLVPIAAEAQTYFYNPASKKCESPDTKATGLNQGTLGACAKSRSIRLNAMKIEQLDVSGSDMILSRILNMDIEKFIARNADLKQTVWEHSKLRYSRWTENDLRGAQFSSVQINNFSFLKVNLAGAHITNSTFYGGDFQDSNFKDSYIVDTVFKDVILPKSIKDQAILINVRFEGCTFK